MPFMPSLGQLSKSRYCKLSLSLTLGATIFALSAGTAQAQVQREIINPSFEDGPQPGTFVIGSDNALNHLAKDLP